MNLDSSTVYRKFRKEKQITFECEVWCMGVELFVDSLQRNEEARKK
jgi:hypothetical protein